MLRGAAALLLTALLPGAVHAAGDWAGRVIPAPATHQTLAADQAGTFEAPATGLVTAGAQVRAGQVLAYLRPRLAAPERGDLDGQLAAARRDVRLGELQVRRFNVDEAKDFDGQIALPSLQILGELRSARVRLAQLEAALDGRVAVVASHDAQVIASLAQAGQGVEPGTPLFELGAAGAWAVEVHRLEREPATERDGWIARSSLGQSWPAQRVATAYDPLRRAQRHLFSLPAGAVVQKGESLRLQPPRAAP